MLFEPEIKYIGSRFNSILDNVKGLFTLGKNNSGERAVGGFDAAQVSAIYNDWVTSIHSINNDIKAGHNKIVARARAAAQNDGYAKKFLNAVSRNVVGHGGFVLRNKAFQWGKGDQKHKKIFDTETNNKIEEAFYEWGNKKYCTITGTESLREVDSLIVKTVARDGEIFIRKVPVNKRKNKFGFTLQLIETEYCDINLKRIFKNGNYIYMGIEFTPDRKPVRYYFKKSHPTQDSAYALSSTEHVVIEADEIIHLFLKESTLQVRGISWLAPSLVRLWMLKEYEKALLMKSRLSANSGILLESREDKNPKPNPAAGIVGAKKDSNDNYTKLMKPGEAFIAPSGYDIKTLDLNTPNGQESTFLQSMLLGIAAGEDVAYVTASGDYKNFNYSASRMELGQEQEGWKGLQSWYIEHKKEPVLERWLDLALLNKAIDLPIDKFDEFYKPWFYGRRWLYYKPSEEIAADVEALENSIYTLEEILAKRGVDLLDHFEQLRYENDLFEEYNIKRKDNDGNSFELVKKNGKANKKETEDAKKN